MTKSEFEKAYDGVIMEGKFCQYTLPMAIKRGDKHNFDTSHDVSIVTDDARRKFGSFTHAHYAGFTEDLINAYFNGDIIWKEG